MRRFSVTTILGRWSEYNNPGINQGVLRVAQERGTEVHRCCSLIFQGITPTTDMPGIIPRVNSAVRWWKFHGLKLITTEQRYEDPINGFFGHPDIVAEKSPIEYWVIDLKTPLTGQPTWKGQMAAYKHLTNLAHGGFVKRAGTLQPDPDAGPAKMIWYDESVRDLAVFLAAVQAEREYTKKGGE